MVHLLAQLLLWEKYIKLCKANLAYFQYTGVIIISGCIDPSSIYES